MIAVIGLMTQLKISFRQTSILMSAQMRPSSPQAVSSAAIAGAARAVLDQRVAGRRVVDHAGLLEDRAELGDRAQHDAAAADRAPARSLRCRARSGRTRSMVSSRTSRAIGAERRLAGVHLRRQQDERARRDARRPRSPRRRGAVSVSRPIRRRPSRRDRRDVIGADDDGDRMARRQLRGIHAADRAGAEDDDRFSLRHGGGGRIPGCRSRR